MKKLFTLAVLGMFGMGIVGCHSDMENPDVPAGTSKTVKKTTVTEPDGDKTTKTEVKRSS